MTGMLWDVLITSIIQLFRSISTLQLISMLMSFGQIYNRWRKPAVNKPKSRTSRVLEYNINTNAGEVMINTKLFTVIDASAAVTLYE